MSEFSFPVDPPQLPQSQAEELLFRSKAETFAVLTHAPKNNSVSFHLPDGTIVGTFDFNQRPCTFIGDVDESARIFVDAICKIFNNQID